MNDWQRTLSEALCWLEKLLNRISSNVIVASFALMISQSLVFGLIVIGSGGLTRFIHDLHLIVWTVVFSLVMISVKNYSTKVRQLGSWLLLTADTSKIGADEISRLSSSFESLILGKWASIFAVIGVVPSVVYYVYWVLILGNFTLVEQSYSGPFVLGMAYTGIASRTFAFLTWSFIEALSFLPQGQHR
jgi:hypothetical protein